MDKEDDANSEPLVWIEEPGKGDLSSQRINLRKVRSKAMRHVVATTQHKKKTQPMTYKFVQSRPKGSRSLEEADEGQVSRAQSSNTLPETTEWLIHSPHHAVQPEWEVFPDLPQIGYADAKSKFGFDITCLGLLTSVHMGRSAAVALQKSQSRMKDLIHSREASFLDFVPSYYPSSSLLRSIVDSTLARAHRMMVPDSSLISEDVIYVLYGKALRELQSAFNNPARALMPDVLCSVQIMQLFEVLDFSQPDFWLKHTAGIKKLVQMRGPLNWASELERSLLCSQLGTIFGEAMLNNEDCFLEEEGWQHVLESMISDDNTKYSPLVISVWRLQILLPRMLRLTGEIIMSPVHDTAAIDSLTLELENFRSLLFRWREAAFNITYQAEQDKHQLPENLAVSYAGQILANRAIIALNPLRGEAARLEEEIMEITQRIFELKYQVQTTTLRGDMLIMRVTAVGNMAQGCHDIFERAIMLDPNYINQERGIVTVEVWDRLNVLMARKIRADFTPRNLADLLST